MARRPWLSQEAKCPTRNQGHWGRSQSGRGLALLMGTFLKSRTGSHREFSALGWAGVNRPYPCKGTKHSLSRNSHSRVEGTFSLLCHREQGSAGPSPHLCIPGQDSLHLHFRSSFSWGGGVGFPKVADSGDCFCRESTREMGCAVPGRVLGRQWCGYIYI